MNRSLLHRLPDIVALARQRAGELPVPAVRREWSIGRLELPQGEGLQRVSLLCGDDLSVMLGLLAGHGREGPMVGQLPLVWLNEETLEPADGQGTALSPSQRETRRLIELATRLFVVRQLLRKNGLLVLTARDLPDGGMDRLLGAVFAQSLRLRERPAQGWRTFLAGHTEVAKLQLDALAQPVPPGPTLLGQLARRTTVGGEPILVLQAEPPHTQWAAELDRRWIFVNASAMRLALLREQVVARQLAAGGQLRAEEPGYDWTPVS